MNISCTQVNLRKSALATGLFSHELSLSPNIGFVTEPHTAFGKIVGKPTEYIVFPELPCASANSTPRAALYVPKTVRCIGMPHLSNADCQVAVLFMGASVLLIASIYLDINHDPVPRWLNDINEYAVNKNYGVLIGADSNSHSVLFGPNDNERGRQLESFILEKGFWVENRGNTPTFQTIRAESFIDLTLSREVEVKNWRVDTNYNASDHNTIRFEIEHILSIPPKKIRPWKQADWKLFSSKLSNDSFFIPERITRKKVDRMVGNLYGCLEAALDEACPMVTNKIKFKGSRWFSDKLTETKKKVRKQFNIAKRVETEEEWEKYKSMHRKLKYKCRKARTQVWRRFVTETEDEHRMARLAKIAQHKSRSQLHTLQKEDGMFTEPGKETLIEMAKAHFPYASQEIPHEPYNSEKVLLKADIESTYCEFLTVDKVRAALEKFKPYKAPGPDGLKAVIFKHLPQVVMHFIFVIYMACIKLQYTPILWQQAHVVFLPKPNKPNYVRGKYFRPIVLSNNFLKGLERIFT